MRGPCPSPSTIGQETLQNCIRRKYKDRFVFLAATMIFSLSTACFFCLFVFFFFFRLSEYSLIGLADSAQESVFRWVNGAPLYYEKWMPFVDPNGAFQENCVVLSSQKTMMDIPCESSLPVQALCSTLGQWVIVNDITPAAAGFCISLPNAAAGFFRPLSLIRSQILCFSAPNCTEPRDGCDSEKVDSGKHFETFLTHTFGILPVSKAKTSTKNTCPLWCKEPFGQLGFSLITQAPPTTSRLTCTETLPTK